MKIAKLSSLFLAALMLLSSVSCSAPADTAGNDTTAPEASVTSADTKAPEETKIVYSADIPEGTDMDGYEFRIMVNDESHYWVDINFMHEEENGNYINDAVLFRERAAEEKLNINLLPIPSPNASGATQKFVSADEDASDLVFLSPAGTMNLITEGMFLELNRDVPNLDLTNPWWDQNAAADLSMVDKLFMVYGDISMMYKRTMSVCLFNKNLVTDLSLANPYELVDQNNWTYESVAALGKGVAQDINNDGAYTMGEDMMVTGYSADQLPILLISGGNFITTKDDEDIPQLTFYNERMVSAYETLASWLFNDELAQLSGGSIDAFGAGKLLMVLCEMHCIPHLRNMEEDFGILPFPKYEASQDRYYHVINPNVACAMMIPITVADPAQVGLVAEVLAAEGKNYITPAYYDYNLTSRDTRDEESVGMLDIIFATTTYDAAHIYDLGGVGTMLRGLASTKNENITSAFEKISKSVQKYIDRSVEKYQEIEGVN